MFENLLNAVTAQLFSREPLHPFFKVQWGIEEVLTEGGLDFTEGALPYQFLTGDVNHEKREKATEAGSMAAIALPTRSW